MLEHPYKHILVNKEKLAFPSVLILFHRNVVLKVILFPFVLSTTSLYIYCISMYYKYLLNNDMSSTEQDALEEYIKEFRQEFCPQRTSV